MLKHLFATATICAAAPLAAQTPRPDSLLNHLVGQWVLEGPMAGKQTVHDLTFQWVLGGEYLQMHEVSRERTAAGTPAYEAIVHFVHDPHTNEYGALWLDNTDYNAFLPAGVGRGKPAPDSIPLVFTSSPTSHDFTTFAYRRASDSWTLEIVSEEAGVRKQFARVTLTRAPAPPSPR
jgi:hypothetical protein